MEELKYQGGSTRLGAFVLVVKNVFSPETCRKIINEYKNDPLFDWAKVVHEDGHDVVDTELRKLRELYITKPEVWMWSSERVEIARMAQEASKLVFAQYCEHLTQNKISNFLPQIVNDEGFKLLHYAEGYEFKEHFDEIPSFGRTLTCSINLSSGYEGGEFKFFAGDYTAELGAGDAVIFPSNFLFPHSVSPITSGDRYSIITWLH